MPDFCCCSGVEFSAQTFCKAWQNAQSCSGEFCPKFPRLGFQTPQCPWMHSEPIRPCGVRAHRGLPCPGLSPHHCHTSTRHRPTAITDTEGRWSLVRERKGSHPGSFSYTGTVSGSVGRGSNRFTHGRVWPQELFLINLKIHPQEFQN